MYAKRGNRMKPVITSDLVQQLWTHMETTYGSELARKDTPEMQLIANMLEEIGVMDTESFLLRFTTTLGNTIYIPFEIGVETERYNLLSQIIICVHEHQHVKQFNDAGPKFSFDYLADSSHRAAYEVEAMKCNMEIYFWFTGEMLDVARLANKLKRYACTDDDIAVSLKALQMISKTVERGGISSDAGKVAIEWLNAA
jgi:hypothetical protein